jgi:hypothetical protein
MATFSSRESNVSDAIVRTDGRRLDREITAAIGMNPRENASDRVGMVTDRAQPRRSTLLAACFEPQLATSEARGGPAGPSPSEGTPRP